MNISKYSNTIIPYEIRNVKSENNVIKIHAKKLILGIIKPKKIRH